MKNFGDLVKTGSIAVLLLFLLTEITAYSFNPWNWRNPEPMPPAMPTMDPSFNQFLRAPYKTCSAGTSGIMKKVEVTPCDSLDRCPLHRGTNITLHFEFIPSFPAKTVVGSLFGVLNSPIPLPAIKFGKPEVRLLRAQMGQLDKLIFNFISDLIIFIMYHFRISAHRIKYNVLWRLVRCTFIEQRCM